MSDRQLRRDEKYRIKLSVILKGLYKALWPVSMVVVVKCIEGEAFKHSLRAVASMHSPNAVYVSLHF